MQGAGRRCLMSWIDMDDDRRSCQTSGMTTIPLWQVLDMAVHIAVMNGSYFDSLNFT